MVHTLWKSVKRQKGKLWVPTPKCHRVTRWAGHQKVTRECLYESAVTFLSMLPRDTHQFTFSQGGNDVRSPRGYEVTGVGGGWIPLVVGTASEGSPPPLEFKFTHSHTMWEKMDFLLSHHTLLISMTQIILIIWHLIQQCLIMKLL